MTNCRSLSRARANFTATGLYYLAELVEEYTVITCKLIYYLILVMNLLNPTIMTHESALQGTMSRSLW